MKRLGLPALAFLLVCAGCAQHAGKNTPEAGYASRLQNLEAGFGSFQEQQRKAEEERRARDADIDAKLRDIAGRLDRMSPAQPAPGSKARKDAPTKAAPAKAPLVAGQVMPYAPSGQAPAATAPAAPAVSQVPAQPLAPAPQAKTPAPVAQAPGQAPAAVPASSLPPIKPPVVELKPQVAAPAAPASRQARQPAPYETPARAKAKAEPRPQAEKPAQAAPAATAAPAAPDQASSTLEEEKLYTEAMRQVTANKNDEGRRKLNELMAKFPNSSKTPLAMFWIGESFMSDKSYNQAILSFKEVTTRYPKHFKAPEALYKIAEAYERLGDKNNAVFHLKLLVDEHADSDLVAKAKQKLKQLGQ